MAATPGDDGWDKWGTHVVLELQRLDKNIDILKESVDNLKLDVREIKTRFLIYGGISGFVVTAAFQLVLWWMSHN